MQPYSKHRTRFWQAMLAVVAVISWHGTARGDPLFADDFARTTGLGLDWDVSFGSYTTDGTAAVSGPSTPADNGNWASVVPSLGTDDYAVQADLTIPAGSSFSGIFARATGTPDILSGDLYDAQIASTGEVKLYKRHASMWTLFQSVPANIQANTPYTVRLVTTGAPTVHLEVWVNGARWISFDDASGGIPSGVPGIQNFDGNVKYANFAVEAVGALFSDNFARTTGLGQNWKVWWGSYTTDGTAAVSGPSTPAENGNWASVMPSLGTDDYAVQADVTIPAGSSFSGIFARATGTPDILTGDLYDAQIASSGQVNLYKRHASQWTLLQSAGASIQAGVPYTLRLVTTGSTLVHLEVWLNGTQLIAADDAAAGIPAGVPGLQNFDGDVRYANFLVSSATPSAAPPPPSGAGTGMTHTPSVLTNVTGGGPMPSMAGAPTASCFGDGVHDDTTCLQTAINDAAAAGKPLLIPATSSFYLISLRLLVTTSLIGVNGTPTIKTINTAQFYDADVLRLADGFGGWIYNLHLVGTWDGTTINPGSEFNHGIDVGCVNGVTIQGNLVERVRGDGVAIEVCANPSPHGTAQNVIVGNNTTRDTWRCGMSVSSSATNLVFRDNVIDKQVNYVSGMDFEPFQPGVSVTSVEVLYNQFVMNNRVVLSNPSSGDASGRAVFGWEDAPHGVTNPGGNFWVHHNYGTFGTGAGSVGAFEGADWFNINITNNAEGASPPP